MSYSMELKSKKSIGKVPDKSTGEQSVQLPPVPMSISEELSSLKGRERTVTGDISKSLRERYGVDMNGIRIFEDEGLRERFGQRGYAKGNEIHLAKGEYSPNTASGKEMLMHEAGHIVQQGSGMVSGSGIVENAALEAQADSGFTAPASFSMPAATASSAIQGKDPWYKRLSNWVDNKWEHVKRSHYRSVDNYLKNKENFSRMKFTDKLGHFFSNPLAVMFGGLEDSFGAEGLKKFRENEAAEEARFQQFNANHDNDSDYDLSATDARAIDLEEAPTGGGNESAQVNAGPVEAGGSGGGIPTFAEGVNKNDMSSGQQSAKSAAGKLGLGGTAGMVLDMGVNLFNNTSGKQIQSRDKDMADALQSQKVWDLVEDIANGKNDDKENFVTKFAHKMSDRAQAKHDEAEARNVINNKQMGLGGSGALINAIGSAASTAGSVINTVNSAQNGNYNEAFNNSLDILGGAAKTGGEAFRAASYFMKSPANVVAAETKILPGVDMARGAIQTVQGVSQLASSTSTRVKMANRMENNQNSKYNKTAKLAYGMSKANQVEGGMNIGSGALKTAGSALKYTGVLTPLGTAMSMLGSGVDFVKGKVVDSMKKDVRTGTVEDEISNLNTLIKQVAEQMHVSEREAKHHVLRKMGIASGKRKEAFQRIAMNRAAQLKKDAESGDEEAKQFIADLGIHSDKEGKYSLQGIAEKLGMDSGTPWRDQMKETRNSRRHDNFKDKADAYEREQAQEEAEKDKSKLDESADKMNKYKSKAEHWAETASNHGGLIKTFANWRAKRNQAKYEKENKKYAEIAHQNAINEERRRQEEYFRANGVKDPEADARMDAVKNADRMSDEAVEERAHNRRIELAQEKVSEAQADVDKWSERARKYGDKGIRARFSKWRLRKNQEKLNKANDHLNSLTPRNADAAPSNDRPAEETTDTPATQPVTPAPTADTPEPQTRGNRIQQMKEFYESRGNEPYQSRLPDDLPKGNTVAKMVEQFNNPKNEPHKSRLPDDLPKGNTVANMVELFNNRKKENA